MSALKTNLTLLLTIGLVAGAFAGTALAQDAGDDDASNESATNDSTTNETVIIVNDSQGNETAPGGNESGTNETAPPAGNESTTNETAPPAGNESVTDDNETSNGPKNAWARHVLALKDARKAALDQFKAERADAVEEYRARLDAIRESYLENKTLVIDACRAEGPDDVANETEDEQDAFEDCVRDGLRPLKEQAREDIDAAKDDFRTTMKDARKAALAEWKDALREAREQHQAEKREHARSMGKGSGPGSNPHEDRPERENRGRGGDA